MTILFLHAGTVVVHAAPLIHATMDNANVSGGGSGDTSVADFTVFDSSGNNLDGLATGPSESTQKVVSGQAGMIGESLQLLEASIDPGLERHVDFGDVANPVPGNGYTASLWFNPTSAPLAPALLKKGAMGSTNQGFAIDLNASSGGFVQITANPNEGIRDNRVGMRYYHILEVDTWYHIALVLDDNNDVLVGYFNGAGSGTTTVTGNHENLANGWVTAPSNVVGNGYAGGASFATDYSLNLGDRWYVGSSSKAPFPGYLDDFSVWNRALSPIEIQSLNTLATEGNLNYDAGQADLLWQVFAGDLAEVTIGNKTWQSDPALLGTPGSVIDLGAGNFGLVLDSDGVGGVTTDFVTFVLGDFDMDNDVDGNDYLVWQHDSGVGSLAHWQTNYGMNLSTVAVDAVPEPSGFVLLVGCHLLVFIYRKRLLSPDMSRRDPIRTGVDSAIIGLASLARITTANGDGEFIMKPYRHNNQRLELGPERANANVIVRLEFVEPKA
ncbi:LamG domain-containing protein [Adhaeretor mobilis]|nr:LamG domain-containing protein [Adhaeretor mobilis]